MPNLGYCMFKSAKRYWFEISLDILKGTKENVQRYPLAKKHL